MKMKKREALLLAGVLMASAVTGSFVYAQRPKTVHLTIDAEEKTLVTNEDTLRAAITEAGLADLHHVEASADLDQPIVDQSRVSLNTEKVITFNNAGVKKTVITHVNTVGDLLREQKVELSPDDVISPARATKLEDQQVVTYDDYETVTTEKKEKVAFKTVTKKTDKLDKGEEKVKTKGVDGVRTIKTQVVYKNGVEAKKSVVSNQVTKKPVNKVVLKGTHVDPAEEASSSGSPALYSLSQFRFQGVVYYSGYKYTFYSQSVLPGGGLRIPGRHVNARGFVADGDGYIVLAGSAPKGTIFPTPFGRPGKIYDRGTTGNHLDVYVR